MTPSATTATRKLTPKEAAERIGCSLWLIYELIRTGRLKATRFGRFWRISPTDVDDVIEHGFDSITREEQLAR